MGWLTHFERLAWPLISLEWQDKHIGSPFDYLCDDYINDVLHASKVSPQQMVLGGAQCWQLFKSQ
jgi:hypothetical protein